MTCCRNHRNSSLKQFVALSDEFWCLPFKSRPITIFNSDMQGPWTLSRCTVPHSKRRALSTVYCPTWNKSATPENRPTSKPDAPRRPKNYPLPVFFLAVDLHSFITSINPLCPSGGDIKGRRAGWAVLKRGRGYPWGRGGWGHSPQSWVLSEKLSKEVVAVLSLFPYFTSRVNPGLHNKVYMVRTLHNIK